MDTIQDVLYQVKETAKPLYLKKTDLVLDHAIYCKAVEIVMSERNTHFRSFISLRMGGSHATCVKFWLLNLGEDQASQILKGKDYDNGIRLHL